MKLEHAFVVPVPRKRAWDVLLDVRQVAPCMPGATLLDVDGDRFTGKVKVKVGPITVTYRGSAEFIERDDHAYRIVLKASGREERGAGTGAATVTATLSEVDTNTTRVEVMTDLDITGKPAQFGRGVMEEVSGALIGQFANRLAERIQTNDAPPEDNASASADHPTQPASASADHPTQPERQTEVEEDASPLNLGGAMWRPVLIRFGPVALSLLAGLLLGRLTRRAKPNVAVVLQPVPVPAIGSLGGR